MNSYNTNYDSFESRRIRNLNKLNYELSKKNWILERLEGRFPGITTNRCWQDPDKQSLQAKYSLLESKFANETKNNFDKIMALKSELLEKDKVLKEKENVIKGIYENLSIVREKLKIKENDLDKVKKDSEEGKKVRSLKRKTEFDEFKPRRSPRFK